MVQVRWGSISSQVGSTSGIATVGKPRQERCEKERPSRSTSIAELFNIHGIAGGGGHKPIKVKFWCPPLEAHAGER